MSRAPSCVGVRFKSFRTTFWCLLGGAHKGTECPMVFDVDAEVLCWVYLLQGGGDDDEVTDGVMRCAGEL